MLSSTSNMKFKESEIVHKWLDSWAELGQGLEIGGSAHNPFGIKNCLNVDFTSYMDTIYKLEEIKLCDEALPVDIVAFADSLPFASNSINYLVNSHVFEHQYNPIKCLLEWHRILKPNAPIASIIPHWNELKSDEDKGVSTVLDQLEDYYNEMTADSHKLGPCDDIYGHYHTYSLESFLDLIKLINILFQQKFEILETQDPDDKVGNGFLVVIKVIK